MINLAAETGASNWLAVLPVDEHGLYLHKTAFRDAIGDHMLTRLQIILSPSTSPSDLPIDVITREGRVSRWQLTIYSS